MQLRPKTKQVLLVLSLREKLQTSLRRAVLLRRQWSIERPTGQAAMPQLQPPLPWCRQLWSLLQQKWHFRSACILLG